MTDKTAQKYAGIPPNTECRALVPYVPPSPAHQRSPGTRLLTFVCAICCLFSLTLVFVNVMLTTDNVTPADVFLRLAESAFLGMAEITPVQQADVPSFPVTDPSESAETDSALSPAVPPDTAPDTDTDNPPVQNEPTYPIEAADVSCGGNVYAIYNETAYEPDLAALLQSPLTLSPQTADAPYILIIHTHGTEAYTAAGTDTYTAEDTFRSTDTAENVVAVGAVMAEYFESAGIPTVHVTEMFDAVSYTDSYALAAEAIRAYLAKYPSIQIVLDVHRDSIIRTDNTKIRPVTTIGGEDVAQFMIVAGTDYKGANHPYWRQNLSFALKIQENLIESAPHFARAINLRGAAFNQQYTKGSLLLEIGSCGNTLEEAKRAGKLAAQAIAAVLKESGQTKRPITLTASFAPRAD